MKVYYFIGLLLRPIAILCLNVYSRIFRTTRTRIIIENDQGQVLLLQTWMSGGEWGLPGGGVERGELPAGAARRELREETGIEIPEEEMHLKATLKVAGHNEMVFTAHTSSGLPAHLPNRFEIKDVSWFSVNKLPPLESLARTVLGELAMSD